MLNSGGIAPVILLECRISISSFTRLDSSGGKLPVVMFSDASNVVKLTLEDQVLDI